MQVKTNELSGAALDWAVAKIENTLGHYVQPNSKRGTTKWEVIPQTRRYCTNWQQGGPIIERMVAEGLTTYSPRRPYIDSEPDGYMESDNDFLSNNNHLAVLLLEMFSAGPTPLIAAMRFYVASKLGETVDIPEELI